MIDACHAPPAIVAPATMTIPTSSAARFAVRHPEAALAAVNLVVYSNGRIDALVNAHDDFDAAFRASLAAWGSQISVAFMDPACHPIAGRFVALFAIATGKVMIIPIPPTTDGDAMQLVPPTVRS